MALPNISTTDLAKKNAESRKKLDAEKAAKKP